MQHTRSNFSKWAIAVVVIGSIAAAIFVASRYRKPAEPSLSPDAARELVHAKNVGLGYLENQSLAEGLAAFEQISAQLPDDPLGPRNIAVARVVDLGAEDEPAQAEKTQPAAASLARLAELEGKNQEYHWLALRLALAQRDFTAADEHLTEILKESPDDAAAWYARFRVGRLGARDLPAEAYAALEKAFELSPSNSWLLVEWLRTTGSQLNAEVGALPREEAARTAELARLREKYAALPERLRSARPTAQAFAYVIQAHARLDVLATIDQAAAAAASGDLRTAATRMMILANVILPHTPVDQPAMRRHPLESVLDRFAPGFYETTGVGEIEAEPAIAVEFALPPAWQVSRELMEELNPVLDVALADFDLDGRLDIIALGTQRLAVLSRGPQSNVWQQVASADALGANRLAVQDFDSDFDETRTAVQGPEPEAGAPNQPPAGLKSVCPTADVDVVVYGTAGVQLFENRHDAQAGSRSLVGVSADKLPPSPGNIRALACADLEADGDLDFALASDEGLQLWMNHGDWSFGDMSSRSVLPPQLADTNQIFPLDWDRDVDVDLLVASPSGGGWLENLRLGQFRWRPFAESMSPLDASAAVEVVDARGDATWDVVATTARGVKLITTSQAGGALRVESPAKPLSDFAATSLLAIDYDNDGAEDVVAWSEGGVRLLRGQPAGEFAAVELLSKLPAKISRVETGDLDGDGDQDLAIVAGGQIQLVENQGGNKNHWIDVGLQAQQIKGQQLSASGRVSPYGLGCLLELKAGARYQARLVRGQTTHFGLGSAQQADVIRIGWLNGVPQNIIRPAADLFVCEQQVLNTSCPYLYAWNGERFEFVTDLLWNAPLGLQLAEGSLAPWRDWEYLKISGRQLVPRDGQYVLQVTAELWEADYFDEIRLIAVDHPAEVDIYSNEKVGSAEMAAYKIHTARQPRVPVAAHSQSGRDLLSEIAAADELYAQSFDRKLRQGVVEQHYLELDLGGLDPTQPLTLFLTGWVYPASTSINVALSQGGPIAPPQPPALHVPDGAGGWKTALPFMGFPGGKTKTIAVDLTGKLTPGDHRVRIETSMEFYWDQIFFTSGEQQAQVQTTQLSLVSADLHSRGFSRVVRGPGNGPEKFLYDDCSSLPKWPPMQGAITRLGDVLELLTARDDRLLVMGAGDEATLRFAAPQEPPPAGWTRDFLLYSAGWDKDANLQTIQGQSSEPLPFRGMSGYPWPAEERTPAGDAYQDYLRQYQTRRQSDAYWKAILRHRP